MKKLFLLCTGIIFSAMSFAQSTLKVTISNIHPHEGTVMIALHNSSKTFPNDPGYRTMEAKADADQVTVTFEDIPQGDYALSVFHDINNNEELDKNIMGIPKEPFGFSNDAMGTFGAPSFEKCIIKVPEKGSVQTDLTMKSI